MDEHRVRPTFRAELAKVSSVEHALPVVDAEHLGGGGWVVVVAGSEPWRRPVYLPSHDVGPDGADLALGAGRQRGALGIADEQRDARDGPHATLQLLRQPIPLAGQDGRGLGQAVALLFKLMLWRDSDRGTEVGRTDTYIHTYMYIYIYIRKERRKLKRDLEKVSERECV